MSVTPTKKRNDKGDDGQMTWLLDDGKLNQWWEGMVVTTSDSETYKVGLWDPLRTPSISSRMFSNRVYELSLKIAVRNININHTSTHPQSWGQPTVINVDPQGKAYLFSTQVSLETLYGRCFHHSLIFPLVLDAGLFGLQGVRHKRPLAWTKAKINLRAQSWAWYPSASVFLHSNRNYPFLWQGPSVLFCKAETRPTIPHSNLIKISPHPNILNLTHLIPTKNQVRVSPNNLM